MAAAACPRAVWQPEGAGAQPWPPTAVSPEVPAEGCWGCSSVLSPLTPAGRVLVLVPSYLNGKKKKKVVSCWRIFCVLFAPAKAFVFRGKLVFIAVVDSSIYVIKHR